MKKLIAFVICVLSSFGIYAQGFLSSPLSCGDPSCVFQYTQGAYTPGIMNSILDHSLKQNPSGFWQYGTTASGGGNGVIIGFNGEIANGVLKAGDPTCVGGQIYLKPMPTSPLNTALVNSGGCNGSGSYLYTSYDEHPGYDYKAAYGTPVRAAAAGTVLSIAGERCYKSNISGTCNSWGYIGIDHGNGYITQYGHLSAINVNAGVAVTEGQVIGNSGNTAPVSLGAHLHFEVLKKVGTVYYIVDPYGWVGIGNDPLYSAINVTPMKLWK